MRTALHQHLTADCKRLMAPHHSLDAQLVSRQTRLLTHHHGLLLDVDIQHELLRCPAGQTKPASLSNRHQFNGVHGAELRPGFVHHSCGTERNAVTEEGFASAGLADETHVLAVGFGGGSQAELTRTLAYLRLGEMTNGKQRVGELTLIQHVHDIALIFGGIGSTHHSPDAGWLSLDARMVAGCDGIKTQQTCAL